MATYVVTGVSKGTGLSSDPKTLSLASFETSPPPRSESRQRSQGRSNIHILRADITSHDDLKQAAADTAENTGGSVEYLISNAGWPSLVDAFRPIGALGEQAKELEETALQLIKTNGKVKKAINIASGTSDLDWTNELEIEVSSLYAMSKVAMSVVTAKFNARYKKDSVLFIGICPGMVKCGHYEKATPEELQGVGPFMAKVVQYAPTFKGPRPPEPAIRDIIAVWERASIERGEAGAFLSHYGNKKWV